MPSNSLITDKILAKRVLMATRSNMPLANNVFTAYKDEWNGKKVGQSILLDKPLKFTAQDGPTRVPQSITDDSVTLTINFHKHVSFDWGLVSKATSIRDIDNRIIKPAAAALARAVERQIALCYRDIFNFVGTAGTTPSSYETITQAKAKLSFEGVPDDGSIVCVLDPNAYAKYTYAISALTGVNQAAMDALRNYQVGKMANMKTMESQHIQNHTCGFADGSVAVNGANQAGTSLVCDNSTDTVVYGDKFTIGSTTTSCYACDIDGYSTGALKCYSVSEAGAVASGGDITIPLTQSMVNSGAYKTQYAAPANNAVLNEVFTNYKANLIYHPNAIAMAVIPIEIPADAKFGATATSANGLSLSVWKASDIDGFSEAVRIDIVAAIKCIQPEFGCVLMG